MTEPNRRSGNMPSPGSPGRGTAEPYASDVLLIADARKNGPNGSERVSQLSGSPSEPMDVESVVRRLIALLKEEQAR